MVPTNEMLWKILATGEKFSGKDMDQMTAQQNSRIFGLVTRWKL